MVTKKQQQEKFDSIYDRIIVFVLQVREPERVHKENWHF